MATVIDLPATISARQRHNNFWLASESSGARGLNGREQVLYTENRYWRGRLDLARVMAADIPALRSVGTRLRGRANLLRVPVYNAGTLRNTGTLAEFYTAAGIPEAMITLGYIPFSDDTSFDDDTGFALPSPDEPVLAAAAAAGAEVITLSGYLGTVLAVGAYFSINDFLYQVETNTDGRVTFSPPLRSAVAAGTTAQVTAPTILCRLETAAGWQVFVSHGRRSEGLQVNLVEAFER